MIFEHKTYTKINTLYKRYTEGPLKNCIMLGEYSDPETQYLKDIPWDWYEKIDGTNISVYWNTYHMEIHGKTSNAQIPSGLYHEVESLFPISLLSKIFPTKYEEDGITEKPYLVRIYGEGYGGSIQGKCGKGYSPDGEFRFRIFDIFINDVLLKMEDVKEIAKAFNVEICPFIGTMTISEAEELVKTGFYSRCVPEGYPEFPAEGLVGRPVIPLFTRFGNRVIVKIKTCDYRKLEEKIKQLK